MNSENKKTNIIIALTLLGLFAIIIVTGFLSGSFFDEESESITIKAFGEEVKVLESAEIRALEYEVFPAVIRSSGQKPVEVKLTGVPLLTLLESLDIDTGNVSKITVKGSDGYASALTMEETEKAKNVYIAYQLSGSDLKPKSRGGNGPYQLIILNDPFSQRWCKYVNEVEIE